MARRKTTIQPNKLGRVMKSCGVSDIELAYKLDFSHTYVNRVKNSVIAPQIDRARRIAGYLGVTMDEIWPPIRNGSDAQRRVG